MDFFDAKTIEYLLKHNYIEPEDLSGLDTFTPPEKINILIEREFLTKKLVLEAIAEEYKLRFIDLESSKPDDSLLEQLPKSFVEKYSVVLQSLTAKKVVLVTSEILKIPQIEKFAIELFKNKDIEIAFGDEGNIKELQNVFKAPLDSRVKKISAKDFGVASEILNEVIEDAIDLNASDIHFEPQDDKVAIRFRIDGVLQVAGQTKIQIFNNLLNRVKVLSNLRIDDHFSSQDGAIRVISKDTEIDLRISIAPTIFGQNMVIRILSRYIRTLSLKELGLQDKDESLLEKSYQRPYGMILAVGPTGSGKTTTLYSIVKRINKNELNITTIEDPVEYKIEGVNQIQVNTQTDVTFAKGLRSIVRQDPDVILVGEIRDKETAEISINAALTGHLLLSTFHANDAATAIPRLLDMGVEPFLLSSTLNLVVAQRLCRKICTSCRTSYQVSSSQLEKTLGGTKRFFKDPKITLYKGKGCASCNQTGYKGRIGVFELIYVTEKLKDLILKNPSSLEIQKAARLDGARSMFEDGMVKVKEGLIDLDELMRVVPADFDSNKYYV